MIRAHGTQRLAAASIAESGCGDAGRRRWRWISRSLQRRAVCLVHTCSQRGEMYTAIEPAEQVSLRDTFIECTVSGRRVAAR